MKGDLLRFLVTIIFLFSFPFVRAEHIHTCPVKESALVGTGLYASHDIDPNIEAPPCFPKHIHLSVGVTPWNSITVSFSVPSKCSLKDVNIILKYGVDQQAMAEVEVQNDAHGKRFNYSSTKEHFGLYESDHIFHVGLTELESFQSYAYQIMVIDAHAKKDKIWDESAIRGAHKRTIVSKEIGSVVIATSPLLNFQTTAAPGGNIGTKIAFVADLGQTYNATVTMLHMYKETLYDDYTKPVTMVLCGGDCSYSDANPNRWDSWFTLIEPLISRVPIQVAVGNHECECDRKTLEMFTPYEHRFRMPFTKPARRVGNSELCLVPNRDGKIKHIPVEAIYHYDYGNSYYGFTHGITHVVVLNCYAPSHKNSRQYNWLLEELRGVDRNITPWLLIMVHCPLYNTFADHHKEHNAEQMLQAMEDLFMEYRVNFVLSGHSHGYSRSDPVAYQKVNKNAPIYITVGEGGCREGHSVGYHSKNPEEWLVKRDNTEFGFGTMDFVNTSYVHWKWIRNINLGDRDLTDEILLENQWLHSFANNTPNGMEESL